MCLVMYIRVPCHCKRDVFLSDLQDSCCCSLLHRNKEVSYSDTIYLMTEEELKDVATEIIKEVTLLMPLNIKF